MIGFLHPWLLAGLAAAAIPVLIHLIARREPPTVVFPAVRYLIDTTREHERRLKLRNLLLLVVRTLLIILLVLAAAGPTLPLGGSATHAPAALVMVVDNSLSSGIVIGGTPRIDALRTAAHRIAGRAGPEDDLWLIPADGIPRKVTPGALGASVDSLEPSDRRLDLGTALGTAAGILASQQRPGEVVVLTDLQASAMSAAEIDVPVLVVRPGGDVPANSGIDSVQAGAQPWGADGGQAVVHATTPDRAVPVTVRLGDRPPRQALVSAETPATVTLGAQPGWWTLRAELDPDELLADNAWVEAVRIAPPAAVSWNRDDRFIATASDVLLANGRFTRGSDITIGALASGASVVQPPADPARLGALNRELAARNVGWQYGGLIEAPATVDSGGLAGGESVRRRYALRPSGSGRTGVVSSVGGAPWVVRGGNVVVLGSRLEPEWTSLPVSARFVPFLDALVNRVARGQVAQVKGTVGAPVRLPDIVSQVHSGERTWRVEGGAPFTPQETGIYYLTDGVDTVGVLAANHDPRESRLEPARDRAVRSLWRTAAVVDPEDAERRVFALGARADFRGPLLWAALVLGLVEVVFASGRRRAP